MGGQWLDDVHLPVQGRTVFKLGPNTLMWEGLYMMVKADAKERVVPPKARPENVTAGGESDGAAGFERKQRWKEQPGNRYTPEELRQLSGSFGAFKIEEPELHIMKLE